MKKIYIIGPNAEDNNRFVEKYLKEEKEYLADNIVESTDMLTPNDACRVYIISLNNNIEWEEFYVLNISSDTVMVKKF